MADGERIRIKAIETHLGMYSNGTQDEIERNETQLFLSHVMCNKNTKSLFDAVGKLSKTLFGTLDADDEKFYEEQLSL
jgi:hypothetical protein